MRLIDARNTVAITSRRSSPFELVSAAQIGEQARARVAVRPHASSWLMKAISSSPVMPCGVGRPIAPAVGRLDGRLGTSCLASVGLLLALQLQVVEELQEHDPGEHRQPVEVAVQPLVLAHDVARGLDEAAKRLAWSSARSLRLSWPLFVLTRHRACPCSSFTASRSCIGAAEEADDFG